jgi:hypothetical protein
MFAGNVQQVVNANPQMIQSTQTVMNGVMKNENMDCGMAAPPQPQLTAMPPTTKVFSAASCPLPPGRWVNAETNEEIIVVDASPNAQVVVVQQSVPMTPSNPSSGTYATNTYVQQQGSTGNQHGVLQPVVIQRPSYEVVTSNGQCVQLQQNVTYVVQPNGALQQQQSVQPQYCQAPQQPSQPVTYMVQPSGTLQQQQSVQPQYCQAPQQQQQSVPVTYVIQQQNGTVMEQVVQENGTQSVVQRSVVQEQRVVQNVQQQPLQPQQQYCQSPMGQAQPPDLQRPQQQRSQMTYDQQGAILSQSEEMLDLALDNYLRN